jgi:hypothetical protein
MKVKMTNDDRAKIGELIVEADSFLVPAQRVQENELNREQRQAALRSLQEMYRAWYRICLPLFVQYEQYGLREEFVSEFEGSWHAHKIHSFFKFGWKPHPIAKWVVPYRRCFEIPLGKQCDVLASLAGIVNKNE